MKIHEFQSKEILSRYGIPVPRGGVAASPEEALAVARETAAGGWLVKAQIHAGGRGKAGGVRRAASADEVAEHARSLLHSRLVTPQTGPQGQRVKRVLVEEQFPLRHELYAAAAVDRARARGVLLASSAGGMDIEEVALKRPEALHREALSVDGRLHPFQARRTTCALGLARDVAAQVQDVLRRLCRLFHEEDCTLAEINPLGMGDDGRVVALDAKIDFDDNASFRHPQWDALRDPDEEDPLEQEAAKYRLNYVKLDGTVGCMVNGAGLAMATMDMIQAVGGAPANFLDVGGGASEETVSQAFRILLSDRRVKSVLINIFGGIMRCDVIARGVLAAACRTNVTVPLVVRLEGTNVEEGRRILLESGLAINVARDMREAAQRAVELGGR